MIEGEKDEKRDGKRTLAEEGFERGIMVELPLKNIQQRSINRAGC